LLLKLLSWDENIILGHLWFTYFWDIAARFQSQLTHLKCSRNKMTSKCIYNIKTPYLLLPVKLVSILSIMPVFSHTDVSKLWYVSYFLCQYVHWKNRNKVIYLEIKTMRTYLVWWSPKPLNTFCSLLPPKMARGRFWNDLHPYVYYTRVLGWVLMDIYGKWPKVIFLKNS
jgi:hypothetical protein